MNRRSIAVAALFAAGLVALSLALAAPRALADASKVGPASSFLYYPSGAGGVPELVDTRTGAIYKRNDTSSRWDLVTKPVEQE